MASVMAWYPLFWLYMQMYVGMYPVGDLSLGPGDDSPPPPRTRMTASYLLNTIRTDKGMLVNILALLSAVLIGVQALLGSRRRRLGSKALFRLPLWAFYTISFPVVSYTIGLVQSVQARDMPDSQLLWAVVLLLLLGSVNGMSAFSRKDIEQSKGMLANHVVQTLLVLWLLFSRSEVSSSRWVLPAYFLLCWIYSIFRMSQRMTALRMASSAHGLVRSATAVVDYMEDIVKDKEHDPKNLSKCKYLVHGEEKGLKPPSKVAPPYLTKVDSSKVVTFDEIWKKDKLLGSGDKWNSQRALKDTCLSFALFKLLKVRFCGDLYIAEAKAREFVVDGLLAEGYERAFRLVEVELSFLYDFFYTKYPVLVATNRLLSVVRFFVLLGFVKVLLVDLIIEGSPSEFDDYYFPEYNFIYFNNFLVVVMILSIDILQGLATGYSNWALVQLVCDYVVDTRDDKKQRCAIRQALMKLVAAWRWRKSAHSWDNKLGQYSLLKSYDYNPTKTGYNALSWFSMRMMEPTGQGRREEKAVPLTTAVKKAVVLDCLKDCLKETHGLPCVGHSIKKNAGHPQLHWACDDLPSHTHMVLVWHIATTMCEYGEIQHNSSNDVSYEHGEIKDMGSNDVVSDKDGHRHVAITLSAYCAYLLAFVPDMLPDNSYKAGQILDAVVEEARTHLGDTKDLQKRCKQMFKLVQKKPSDTEDMQKRCKKLFELAAGEETNRATPQDVKGTQILMLGARLGLQLSQSVKEREQRWKLLARFWAELVLFLAPSNNADVHAEHLAKGGEFITHLSERRNRTGLRT